VDGSGRAQFDQLPPGRWEAVLVMRTAASSTDQQQTIERLMNSFEGRVQVARADAQLAPGPNHCS
jgi:hypothetical protein